jgi:hypothetical protein
VGTRGPKLPFLASAQTAAAYFLFLGGASQKTNQCLGTA